MAQRNPWCVLMIGGLLRTVALSSADFIQHYHQVRDVWGGVRTPDGR